MLVGGGASALAIGGASTRSDAVPAAVASTTPAPDPAPAATTAPAAAGSSPAPAPTSSAAPAPVDQGDGAVVLDRRLGDHHGHDGQSDHDGWGKVRGTLTAVDGSALTVTTSSGESTLSLDATTDVVRDHQRADLGALATGQDVVVVESPGSIASQVIVLG